MADKIITQEDKNRVRRILDGAGLDWFRCEPSFRFLDSDDDECIVVGWGGWRKAETIGSLQLHKNPEKGLHERYSVGLCELQFRPATLVGAYSYKGEQFLCSIPDLEGLEGLKPYPES